MEQDSYAVGVAIAALRSYGTTINEDGGHGANVYEPEIAILNALRLRLWAEERRRQREVQS